ncbi:MAG TPA: SDR family NAD(P)-dependent oxidoreductase [Candidatus Saccharimonadales bacterium]|jgi:short-subunit dehydrogenase|nr:SDR family NAD(P)-dependent oxidoreductase [Candidatus Saccharimonadales bacterium]
MKNILVAGGTDGIGLAFVKGLNPKHYDTIYVLGRHFEKVRPLHLADIIELECDITDQESLAAIVSKIDTPIDQFVNTIGTFHKGLIDEINPTDVASHFEVNAIANINLTNEVLKKLKNDYAEILVCSANLALEAREIYALQSATKAAYRFYLEALRKEKRGTLKVMMLYPSSVSTEVFKKSGDMRDTSLYPKPKTIAQIMLFMLNQPMEVNIPEIRVNNFTKSN